MGWVGADLEVLHRVCVCRRDTQMMDGDGETVKSRQTRQARQDQMRGLELEEKRRDGGLDNVEGLKPG